MISFRSKITRKILDYFFMNPAGKQYASAIANMINEDAKNVHRKLLELQKEGVLVSEFSGKQRYFSISGTYPLLDEVRKIFFASAGFEYELTRILRAVTGVVEAYLFGSYVKQSMDTQSDIDLLIIGNHSEIDLQKKINPLQRTIYRTVNSISMTPQELVRRRGERDAFIEAIFNHGIKRII